MEVESSGECGWVMILLCKGIDDLSHDNDGRQLLEVWLSSAGNLLRNSSLLLQR